MDIIFLIIPLFAGIFMKIVDEIEDVNILNLKEYKEYFYTLCTLFLSLALYDDIFVSIYWIIVIIPCYFLKQIDNLYWKTMIPLPFITFLLKINSLQYINTHDIIQQLCVVFWFVFGTAGEAILFPEENSTNKIIIRVSMIIILILENYLLYLLSSMSFLQGYVTYTHSSVSFLQSISMFGIGYFIVSIISKTLFTDETEKVV
jgi:hypothetical protein